MEDECLKGEKTSFFDLFDKGLTEIVDYADNGDGKNDAIIVTDGKGVIVHSNQAWEHLCGFSISEIKGKTNSFLQGPLTCKEKAEEINQNVLSGLAIKTSLVNYRKSGKAFENKLTIIPVYDWLNDNQKLINYNSRKSATKNITWDAEESFSQYLEHYVEYNDEDSSEEKVRNLPSPSHFVARLDVTEDYSDLPSLTTQELMDRGIPS
jgi:PAS domain S-box-containing protein